MTTLFGHKSPWRDTTVTGHFPWQLCMGYRVCLDLGWGVGAFALLGDQKFLWCNRLLSCEVAARGPRRV